MTSSQPSAAASRRSTASGSIASANSPAIAPPAEMELARTIKRALDPDNRLNPGKVILP